MDAIAIIISGFITPTAVGIFLYLFSKSQDKREAANNECLAKRQTESLLALEMITASADLSYATAVAVKRGYANGEVEVGVEAYLKAKENYRIFMTAQAVNSTVV